MRDNTIEKKRTILISFAVFIIAIIIMVLVVVRNNIPHESAPLNTVSDSELESLLDAERSAIEEVIAVEYDTKNIIAEKSAISNIKLFGEGQYCGVIIDHYVYWWQYYPDRYRAILVKENGEWKLQRYPELVLNYTDYDGLPAALIQEVNAM